MLPTAMIKPPMEISFILRILFCIGLFILPFVYWPWAEVTHEVPRVWFVLYWVEVLILAGLPSLVRKKTPNWGDKASIWLSIGFLVIAYMASFLGIDKDKSLWGNYWRFDGLLVLLHCIGLTLFLRLWWHRSWSHLTTLSITLGAVGVSSIALWSVFRVYVLKDYALNYWNDAFGSTFGQPNYLAGYLIISFPLLLSQSVQAFKKKRVLPILLWSASTLIVSTALIFTHAVAAVPILLIIGMTYWFLHRRTAWYWLLGCVVFITICTSIIYYRQTTSPTVFVAESRERIVHKVILGWWQRPILGWGWANVDHAFESSIWPYPVRFDVYLDKAHSTILEVLATTGIMGLSVYLLLIIRVGSVLYRKARSAPPWSWHPTMFVTFITIVLHSQTNVISIAEETFFWMIVGIAGVQDTKN